MASIIHVAENFVETPFTTTFVIIGWRAHYASGAVRTSLDTAWTALPATGLILLMLIEAGQYAPGLHYRDAIQAEWFGYAAATDTYYIIDPPSLSLTEIQLRWPTVAAWKQGQLVSDAVMEAAFDADRAEWAV